jgi:hypothetical protein
MMFISNKIFLFLYKLRYDVMVASEILILFVKVRVLMSHQNYLYDRRNFISKNKSSKVIKD